ncbi:MAG: electron transfer flavoprotein subunit alpha/FixB family protein [Rhodospirillales bacterium]|nr:electron transfer flavoprotein subunit alpha/FixB family protein [Rhodospirillales bacterium]
MNRLCSRSDIAVLAEFADGAPLPLATEMLGLARRLADETGGAVTAMALGTGMAGAGDALLAHGADRVFVADDPALAPYQADAWMAVLVDTLRDLAPAAVLAGHGAVGADLAPRLAFRLETAAVTDCIAVSAEDGGLRFTRPCYGGKAHEVISVKTAPAVVTLRAKSHAPAAPDDSRRGEVVALSPDIDPAKVRTRIVEKRRDTDDGQRLDTARVVIAGGRGLDGAEGFQIAGDLADTLGGALGASRVACDLGWCPPSRQIGLSGRTVAPELYLALGISGAAQHMSGCAGAKTIVAVNTDAQAPIFKYCRFGVIGDCRELAAALIEALDNSAK